MLLYVIIFLFYFSVLKQVGFPNYLAFTNLSTTLYKTGEKQ